MRAVSKTKKTLVLNVMLAQCCLNSSVGFEKGDRAIHTHSLSQFMRRCDHRYSESIVYPQSI